MIRVGVIGASGVGSTHVAALRTIGDIDVAAVAGSSETSTTLVADRLGVRHRFVGHHDMIRSGVVDAVHVCTPNDRHAPSVAAALEAGLRVVCEKPLASTRADASELVELSSAAPLASTVCYHYRYSPLAARLAELVRRGELGAVHSVRASYLQNWQLNRAPSWRDDPGRAGASRVLADIGTHLLDLVEVVSGARMTTLRADSHALRTSSMPGADDVVTAHGRLPGGGLVSLFVSQVSPGHMNVLELAVDGDRASARWRLDDRESLSLVRFDDAQTLRVDGHAGVHTSGRTWSAQIDPGERLAALFRDFYGQPSRGTPVPIPTFSDAARHVGLIETAVGA